MPGHRQTHSVLQNQKALLANAYNELGKELSSMKIRVVGNYTLGKVIGEGAYGKVRLGTHRLTSMRVAIKQIPKAMSSSLTREIHHHRQLHHPHVAQMYEVIATESHIWIVTELCSGGELFDYLVEKGRLSEREAKIIFGQLCLAVNYLHEKGIVHRDLKLENVLLDERCRVKLGDFGFTREFEKGSLMETFCGTTGYASPEMLQGKKYQGPEVDVWSLGVILYTLLTGTLPFDDDDEAVMREKIIVGEFDDPAWLSLEARDLIKKILVKDTAQRLTIPQILGQPWFKTQILSYETAEPDEAADEAAVAAEPILQAEPTAIMTASPPGSPTPISPKSPTATTALPNASLETNSSSLNPLPNSPPISAASSISTSQYQSAPSSVESYTFHSTTTSASTSSIPTTPDDGQDDDKSNNDHDDDESDDDDYDNDDAGGVEADNSAEEEEDDDEEDDVYVDDDSGVGAVGVVKKGHQRGRGRSRGKGAVEGTVQDQLEDDPFLSLRPKAKDSSASASATNRKGSAGMKARGGKTTKLKRNASESTVTGTTSASASVKTVDAKRSAKEKSGGKEKEKERGRKGPLKEDVDDFYARTGRTGSMIRPETVAEDDNEGVNSARPSQVSARVMKDEEEEDGGDVLSALPSSIGLRMKMKVSAGPQQSQEQGQQHRGRVHGSVQIAPPIPSAVVSLSSSSTSTQSASPLPPIQTTFTATTTSSSTPTTNTVTRISMSTRSTSAPPQPPIHPVRTPARTKRRSVSSTNLDEELISTPSQSPDPMLSLGLIPDPSSNDKPSSSGSGGSKGSSASSPTALDFFSLLATPSPIIFSTPLERQLLNELSGLGFDAAQIVHSVLSNACDSAGAVWWMVKKKREMKVLEEVERKERETREREKEKEAGGGAGEKKKEGAAAEKEGEKRVIGRSRSHSQSLVQQSTTTSTSTRVRSGSVAATVTTGAGTISGSNPTSSSGRSHRVKVNAGVQTDLPPPRFSLVPPTPTLSSRFSTQEFNAHTSPTRDRESRVSASGSGATSTATNATAGNGDKFGTPTRSSLMMLSPSSSSTLGTIAPGGIAMGDTGSGSGSVRSNSATPAGSMKEKSEKEGKDKDAKDTITKVSAGRKNRSGSVSIMQRATTALEAAGLVRKKSSEAFKEEKEREKEKEKERVAAAAAAKWKEAAKDVDRKLSSSASWTSGDELSRSSYASLSGISVEGAGAGTTAGSGSGSGIRNKLTKSSPTSKHPYQPTLNPPHPSSTPPPISVSSATSATSLSSMSSTAASTPTQNTAAKAEYQMQLLNSPWILAESGEAVGRMAIGSAANGSSTSVGGSTTPLGSPGRGSALLSLLGGGTGCSKNVAVVDVGDGDMANMGGDSGGDLHISTSAPNLAELAGSGPSSAGAIKTSTSTPGIAVGSTKKSKDQRQSQTQGPAQPQPQRHRANILTAFRLWFHEDRKGKRKEQAAATATAKPAGSGKSAGALYGYVTRNGYGTGKRRGSNSNGTGGRFGRSGPVASNTGPSVVAGPPAAGGGHRAQRPSVSSRRSSSINSRRSSAASVQMMVLDSPQMPPRRSFGGSHTPNSERAVEHSSRPSSVKSFSMNGNNGGGSNGQRHRKSPSASSGGSAHYRTASPITKYHRRAGSGSSGSRPVRQLSNGVRASAMHHSTSASSAYSNNRHMRSGSTASSLHSPTSSRPASFYEFSESEGPSPSSGGVPHPMFGGRRNESPYRGIRRRNTTGGWDNDSTPRKGYSYSSYSSTSIGRSTWKKSWGLEPPGWQTRTAAATQLPYEVLAISVVPGHEPSTIRDVFSGGRRGSVSNGNGTTTEMKWVAGGGDDSDWVDEDDDVPTFAGGLGQTGFPASMLGPVIGVGSGGSSSSGHALGLQSIANEQPSAPHSVSAASGGSASRHRGGALSSITGPGGNVTGIGPSGRRSGRASPVQVESVHESATGKGMNLSGTESRTGRRQLPNTRPGLAFKHAIQEEDEDEE